MQIPKWTAVFHDWSSFICINVRQFECRVGLHAYEKCQISFHVVVLDFVQPKSAHIWNDGLDCSAAQREKELERRLRTLTEQLVTKQVKIFLQFYVSRKVLSLTRTACSLKPFVNAYVGTIFLTVISVAGSSRVTCKWKECIGITSRASFWGSSEFAGWQWRSWLF